MPRKLIWVHSLNEAQYLPIQDFGDLTIEDRLGGLQTLVFTIQASDPKAFAVIPDVLVQYDGRLYRVEEIRQYRERSQPLTKIYAEARWMDLGKILRVGTLSVLGQTALAGLTTILAGSGWTAAVSPPSTLLYSMEDIDASALALTKRWASVIGREIQFNTAAKTVNLVPAIGQDRGIGFRWGNNIKSIQKRYRPPVATRLYPIGANNLEITSVNPLFLPYVEDYSWYISQGLTLLQAKAGYKKDQVWVDTRYLLALNLYDAGVTRLASLAQPTISYELSVADFLRLTSSTADDVQLGDSVRVFDASFGIDVKTRIVRRVTKPFSPANDEIELAYLQEGLGAVQDSTTSRSINYDAVSIFVDQNTLPQTVSGSNTIFATIQLTSTSQTTVVSGGTVKGTATGTGTVRWSLAVDGVDQLPVYDFAFVAGQVEFSWPSFVSGIDASSTTLITWRGRVTAGVGTISIAVGEGKGWLLVKGAVGVGVNISPNQSVEQTLVLVVCNVADSSIVEIIAPVDLISNQDIAAVVTTVNDNAAAAPIVITIPI